MGKNGSVGSPHRRSVGVTAFGVMMLIYSLLFLLAFLFNYRHLYSSIISLPTDFAKSGLFLNFLLFCVGFIYLISSINILRLKNWSRITAVYFSALIVLTIVAILIIGYVGQLRGEYIEFDMSILVSIPLLPCLIFLIFFTRPKVKEQFR